MKTPDQKLARKWACDERTIRRWRKETAPLNHPGRMRAWLASRKHIPAGTAALLEQMRASDTAQAAQPAMPEAPLKQGAGAALSRLETAEARAYAAFKRATEGGDPILVKTTRETWLKISESLRRFDQAVAEHRRDIGELIQREEVLRLIHILQQGYYFAVLQSLEGIVPSLVGLKSPHDVWEILSSVRDHIHTAVIADLEHGRRKLPVPVWMTRAFKVSQFTLDADDPVYKNYWESVGKIVEFQAAHMRQKIDAERAPATP